MATAIIVYANIPGFEELDKELYKNPQFAKKMDFDVFRRILLKTKRINHGVYEFTVNGITYRARLVRNMQAWERAYYANVPETCITELMNVYP